MLGELRGKLIKIVSQLDLTAQGPECLGDGATAPHRNQSGDRAPGALDDDLFAVFGEADQPRQLALGFMHSDTDHHHTVAGLARTDQQAPRSLVAG